MEAKIISFAEWKAAHPPIMVAIRSCQQAQIRCWMNWSKFWFPWM